MLALVIDQAGPGEGVLRDEVAPMVYKQLPASLFIAHGFGDKIGRDGIFGALIVDEERGWDLARTHPALERSQQCRAGERGQVFLFFLEQQRRGDVGPRVPLPVGVVAQRAYQLY